MTKALQNLLQEDPHGKQNILKINPKATIYYLQSRENFVVSFIKNERKKCYNALDIKNITNNKQFWKTIKPFLSEKGKTSSNTALKNQDRIISNNDKV